MLQQRFVAISADSTGPLMLYRYCGQSMDTLLKLKNSPNNELPAESVHQKKVKTCNLENYECFLGLSRKNRRRLVEKGYIYRLEIELQQNVHN